MSEEGKRRIRRRSESETPPVKTGNKVKLERRRPKKGRGGNLQKKEGGSGEKGGLEPFRQPDQKDMAFIGRR